MHVFAASSSGGGSIANFLPLLLIVVAFFFLLVRPQRARQRKLKEVQSTLLPGAEVMTTSGLFATVIAIEGDAVTLEIAPGVHARYLRGAISRVVPAVGSQDVGSQDVTAELPPDDRPPV